MRRRSQPHSFEDQITAQRALLVEQAALLDKGPEREKLVEKIRQLETVSERMVQATGFADKVAERSPNGSTAGVPAALRSR